MKAIIKFFLRHKSFAMNRGAPMLLALFVFLLQTGVVSALSDDQLKLLRENILYFNIAECATGELSSTTLVGGDTPEKIYNYFLSKGLEPFQAAGIVGNVETESAGTFSPEVVQGSTFSKNPAAAGTGGYGLFQFTPGEKLNGIIADAKIQGEPYEIATQLDAVWAQLTGKAPSYDESAALNELKGTTNVHDATAAFMGAGDYNGYERPADQSESALAPRAAAARAYLTKFSGGSPSVSGPSSGPEQADGCCPPAPSAAPVAGEVADGSPSDWKKLYTGANKSKVASLSHGKLNDPKILVIHYTVGDDEGQDLLNYFDGTPDKLGIQFNVGKDGKVYQYYPLNDMRETYHVGDANSKAIGIEITGRDVNDLLNNQKQFESVASLAKFLCDQYSIPCSEPKGDITGDSLATAQGMLGHDETPTNDHNDPDAKYGETISRSDSSKHAYMMKLRTAMGFDPTPGKDGDTASPSTVTDPQGAADACGGAADTATGSGTKENPVGEGVNRALALEAVKYDTKTNDGKYTYDLGGLHHSLSELEAFAKNGGTADCSGFVRYIIWRVYGKDIGSFVTQDVPKMSVFKEVDPSEVAAGDIGWNTGHVDFITENKGGGKLHQFGAHSPANDLYGGDTTADSYQKFFRYVGPKASGGGE